MEVCGEIRCQLFMYTFYLTSINFFNFVISVKWSWKKKKYKYENKTFISCYFYFYSNYSGLKMVKFGNFHITWLYINYKYQSRIYDKKILLYGYHIIYPHSNIYFFNLKTNIYNNMKMNIKSSTEVIWSWFFITFISFM